jgi:hypothetical protein
VNTRLDRQARQRVRLAASSDPSELGRRLESLDREWDVERVIEAEAALTGLAGLALGAGLDRRLLAVPMFAFAMVLIHGLHGWYPLLPLLRRFGARTEDEIARERYAIKALRGDFAALPEGNAAARAAAVWQAVLR